MLYISRIRENWLTDRLKEEEVSLLVLTTTIQVEDKDRDDCDVKKTVGYLQKNTLRYGSLYSINTLDLVADFLILGLKDNL